MKMKKRNKLQWLAFMLVAALMMTVATPTVSARAMLDQVDPDEDVSVNVDFYGGSISGYGYGGKNGGWKSSGGKTVSKASAYSSLPWYANTGSAVNTGRGANKITPNTSATGDHVVYKANITTGQVTNYAVYTVNLQNPTGFDEVIRYDGEGKAHTNKVTGARLMPHVHDNTVPGNIRAPFNNELPR